MKPFNLEAALRGEPVVTREGKPFVFGGYNPKAHNLCKVAGWIETDDVKGWCEDGSYTGEREHELDLFMAEKPKLKRSGYIGIIKVIGNENCVATTTNVYSTPEQAAEASPALKTTVIPVEWEEEA